MSIVYDSAHVKRLEGMLATLREEKAAVAIALKDARGHLREMLTYTMRPGNSGVAYTTRKQAAIDFLTNNPDFAALLEAHDKETQEKVFESGKRIGMIENHAFIESARILIQRARVDGLEVFVRSADIWLDEWSSREERAAALRNERKR